MSAADTAFDTIHAFTARWEGGYADHPADAGGPTHHGVSLRWLRSIGQAGDVDGDGDVDEADIRALTPDAAARLFYDRFWQPLKCGRLPFAVAACLYDAAVNCGPGQAVRFAQRAANRTRAADLAVDGKLGPLTLRQLMRGGAGLAGAMLEEREAFYRRLVAQKPSQAVFLAGWLNRVDALRQFLGLGL